MPERKYILSGNEMKAGDWYCEFKQTARLKNNHNATELRHQLSAVIKMSPGGKPLGNAIKNLPDLEDPLVGYNGQATRHWSIESTGKNDSLIAMASIVNTNGEVHLEANELGDNEKQPFDTMQEAAAWVAGKLGHPALQTKIEEIVL